MTAEYILQQLLDIGEKMREAQRGFFNTDRNRPDIRKNFLDLSKKYEKQFDQLLAQAKLILKS